MSRFCRHFWPFSERHITSLISCTLVAHTDPLQHEPITVIHMKTIPRWGNFHYMSSILLKSTSTRGMGLNQCRLYHCSLQPLEKNLLSLELNSYFNVGRPRNFVCVPIVLVLFFGAPTVYLNPNSYLDFALCLIKRWINVNARSQL